MEPRAAAAHATVLGYFGITARYLPLGGSYPRDQARPGPDFPRTLALAEHSR